MNRTDFPAIRNGIAYFDSSCVSLKPQSVIDVMNAYYTDYTACAGRSSHAWGEKVTAEMERSRETLAKFFNVKSQSVSFTRNTTEAINIVAHSTKGCVLTSDKEHNSNLVPWLRLKNQKRISHFILPTDENGISMDTYESLLSKQQISLVAVHATSNLDGMSLPIKEMAKLAHKHGAKVLVDGAQAAGHKEVDLKSWDVDYFACSGHKMLGPSGTGLLYAKDPDSLEPLMLGGETVKETWLDRYELEDAPHRFEAGLQDYAGILGFGEAARYLQKIGLSKIEKHCGKINEEITQLVSAHGMRILGNRNSEKRGSITSVIPNKMKIHELNLMLSNAGVYTRSGAFCVHSWFNKHNLPGAVRFSAHLYNDDSDVEKARAALDRIKGLL
ncbi:MAG: aminotransferase class V-fold PLP-dependent enzyme [Nanoarchaeota archaeon]|nr:aminotransferase class V-fold PLP-dependent enzyme [Nanoarchaeota archaeon]